MIEVIFCSPFRTHLGRFRSPRELVYGEEIVLNGVQHLVSRIIDIRQVFTENEKGKASVLSVQRVEVEPGQKPARLEFSDSVTHARAA